MDTNIDRMLMKLPIAMDWVEYKGETLVASINYQATQKAKRPMMDLSYCMTTMMNGRVDKTVQWDKNKFKPSKLATTWKI